MAPDSCTKNPPNIYKEGGRGGVSSKTADAD